MSFRILFLLFAASAFMLPVSAEEPLSGRTSDGRAYRTDANGNQIVDYIAELELEKAGLERKVRALQGEVEDLRSGASLVKSGVLEPVRERDLTGSNTAVKKASEELQAVQCPEPEPGICDKQDCLLHVRPVRQQLDDVQAALLKARAERESLESRFEKAEREVQLLEARLSSSASKSDGAEAALAVLQDKNNSLRREVSRLQSAANEEDLKGSAQITSLQKQVRAAEDKILELREQNRELESALDRSEEAMARVNWESTQKSAVSPVVTEKQEAALSRTQQVGSSSAVQSLRGKLRSELTRLRRLEEQRTALFSGYKGSGLQVNPQPLRSDKGRSLSTLSNLLEQGNSIGLLTTIQAELRQIRSTLREDIELVRRLQK